MAKTFRSNYFFYSVQKVYYVSVEEITELPRGHMVKQIKNMITESTREQGKQIKNLRRAHLVWAHVTALHAYGDNFVHMVRIKCGGTNQAYSRLSTIHGHITDWKLDSIEYAGVCVVS